MAPSLGIQVHVWPLALVYRYMYVYICVYYSRGHNKIGSALLMNYS